MLATSTFIFPQKVMVSIILYPDVSNHTVTPAYFSVETTKYMLDRKLVAIETFNSTDIPYSPLNPNMPVLNPTQFSQMTLTLLRQPGNNVPGGDFYKNVPLHRMRRVWAGANTWTTAPALFRCEPTEISFSDSYIQGENFSISVPTAAVFLLSFILPEQDPRPYSCVPVKK